jgi:geranylgeranyl reductase family protein
VKSCDVIVVGAGPAGATLGHELARRGLSVLILEKEKMPRDKTCAGGLPRRTAGLLDLDIGTVAERTTYGARITYRLSGECIKRHRRPFIYMVTRSSFDHMLVKKAQESGATLIEEAEVEGVEADGRSAKVATTGGDFEARVVIGADGANGVVAKSAGLMRNARLDLALQAEVGVSAEEMARWESLIGIDQGQLPGGYGWVFPKKDHLAVGVGGGARLSKRLKPYLERMLRHVGVDEIGDIQGGLLPMRGKGMAIQKGNTLLLGDAAGLVNPITREGIYYAIMSARLAAPVIADALQSESIDLSEYQRAVDDQLMPSLQMGGALRQVFTQSPRLCFTAVKRSDLIWRYACWAMVGTKPVLES